MEGMTAEESSCGEPAATNDTVPAHRFARIYGTGRFKSAHRREQWGQESLVSAQKHDHDSPHHRPVPAPLSPRFASRAARSSVRRRSVRKLAKSAAAASGRMLTTRSTGSARSPASSRFCLKISRVQRFRRFRWFAFPTFLVAVIPNLGPLPPFGFPKTTTYRPKVFLPVRYVSRYSRRLRIRSSLERDADSRFAAVMSDAAARLPSAVRRTGACGPCGDER